MSRDDGQLGSDDEEDGDDEEEVEKEEGAENDEGTEEKEDQMVVNIKSLPATAQEGNIGPAAKKQDSQEDEGGREERSQATEDKVVQCESERVENCNQEQGRTKQNIIDQSEHLKENKVVIEGGGETISVNTKDSHTETEGDTQGQSNTLESSETNNQKLTETETEKCQAVSVADNRNGAVTTDEAELNSHAEPMEVEATETSTTGTSAAVRGDEDMNTGWILGLSHA